MSEPVARASRRSPFRRAAAALLTSALFGATLVATLAPAEPAAAIGPVIDCTSDPSFLNTGYDGAGGRLTSGFDTNWDWGGGNGLFYTPSTVPAWADGVIVSAPVGTWAPSPYSNASWIAHNTDGTHPSPTPYYFRYLFELDPAVQADGFSVTLDFYADNSVSEIWINGVAQSPYLATIPQAPLNPWFHPGFAVGAQATTTLDQDWQTGQNEIVVEIMSAPGQAGFLAQTTSTGFCADYGDAPTAYGTADADGGASHILEAYDGISSANLLLGASVDPEADATGFDGSGDDVLDLADEDGVASFDPLTVLSGTYSTTVAVTNDLGTNATLAGWIDFDGDGLFEASERATVTVPDGATSAVLDWSGLLPTAGDTYARFRIYPGDVADPSPVGQVFGGEVEDYPLTIAPGDLEIEKLADATVVEEGDIVEYTITVTNNGLTAASDVSISDDLTEVLDDAVYLEGSADTGTLSYLAGVLTWTGDLAVDQTATITYTVQITSTPDGDRQLDNVVVDTSRLDVITSNCPPDSDDPDCDASVTAEPPTDFGDAPDSYGTTSASGGAEHALFGYDGLTASAELVIGASVDAETDSTGDDNATGAADEDGATFAAVSTAASSYSLTVEVVNSTASDATLAGWIDFDRDGTFDANERTIVTVAPGATSVQLEWTGFITSAGSSWARLRLYDGTVLDPLPTGGAAGGEVEDYAVTFVDPPAALLALTGSVLPSGLVIALGGLLAGLGVLLAARRRARTQS